MNYQYSLELNANKNNSGLSFFIFNYMVSLIVSFHYYYFLVAFVSFMSTFLELFPIVTYEAITFILNFKTASQILLC